MTEPKLSGVSRRGRPSRAESRKTDRDLLASAWQVFLTAGFEGASMEAIADGAGVSKVTLYARHADKIALLRAVVDDRIEDWSAMAKRGDWRMGDTLEQRLTHYATTMLTWGRNDEVRALRRLVDGSYGKAAAFTSVLRDAFSKPMEQLIAHEIVEHGTPAENAGIAACLLMGMVEAIADTVCQRSPPEGDERLAARIVAVLLRGRAEW